MRGMGKRGIEAARTKTLRIRSLATLRRLPLGMYGSAFWSYVSGRVKNANKRVNSSFVLVVHLEMYLLFHFRRRGKRGVFYARDPCMHLMLFATVF